jgi:uncharacterized OsmC-like protein
VLVVRRIHVTYSLRLRPEQRATAERVLGIHADSCPVYRTIGNCVDFAFALDMHDVGNDA